MLGTLGIVLLAAAPAKAATPPSPAPAVVPISLPQECPAWGTKPEGCVEPPLKDDLTFYNSWDENIAREQAEAGLIRGPRSSSDYRPAIARELFPAELRRGEADVSIVIAMRVLVGPDDSIRTCQIVSMQGSEKLGQQQPVPFALDLALGERACNVVRQHGKFRHGINAAGEPVAAPISMSIKFTRQRYETRLAPAPPPPVRWIGKGPYDRSGGWPPTREFPRGFVSLQPPKWQDFVAGQKHLPKSAVVGVFLDFAKGGALAGCRIGRSSGNTVLDDATCRALDGAHNPVPVWGPIQNYPIEVRWKKNKAELVYPAKSMPPNLVVPILIAQGDVPSGALPKEPIDVAIQVDPSGKVVSCKIDYTWNSTDAFDAKSCALAVQRGKFSGGINSFGGAAEGGLRLQVDWQKLNITVKPGYF